MELYSERVNLNSRADTWVLYLCESVNNRFSTQIFILLSKHCFFQYLPVVIHLGN